MKPSFSLKWLFVGIAILALVCGWSADRQRWNAERLQLTDELHRAREELTDLHWHQFQLFGSLFTYGGTMAGAGLFEGELSLEHGDLDENLAYAIAATGLPRVDLYKVKVHPDAQAVMALNYDRAVEGDHQKYRLRRPPAK